MAVLNVLGLDPITPGTIIPYAGSVVPSGWLECNSAVISRTDYADLFARIGTAYGAGNGSTTFNLPDFRGKIPIGDDGSTYQRGNTGGTSSVTLVANNLPTHTHAAGYSVGNESANHTHLLSTSTSDAHTHGGTTNPNSPVDARIRNPTQHLINYSYNAGSQAGFSLLRSSDLAVPHTHGTYTSANQSVSHYHSTSSVGNQSASHNHAVSGNSGNNATTNSPMDTRQPYGVAAYIIRAK